MDKRTAAGLILAVLFAAAGIFCLRGTFFQKKVLPTHVYTFSIMGTTASFSFSGVEQAAALRAAESGKAAFEEVTKIANLYDQNSELSRLNMSAYRKEFICSRLLWQMIEEAAFAWHFSGGAFDITVKPLMDLWGFYRKRGKIPLPAEIVSAREKTGFEKLILNRQKRSIRFSVPGMALDLGGIAKGFALDLAAAKVSPHIQTGVLDLGGNLKFLSHPPAGRSFYTVGIKDPGAPHKLKKTVTAAPGTAVSTSGDYERFVTLENKKFGHIINVRTGIPQRKNGSATVIAPSAMRADWLSTAAFQEGKMLAEKIRKELADCRVIWVEK
ncbi:MAG: FAD:protein FMN transferase [Lentisphaeria bacterium]|nr:FAD:protein FMN transferase [Lentisphaeria bacterium]